MRLPGPMVICGGFYSTDRTWTLMTKRMGASVCSMLPKHRHRPGSPRHHPHGPIPPRAVDCSPHGRVPEPSLSRRDPYRLRWGALTGDAGDEEIHNRCPRMTEHEGVEAIRILP